MAKIKGPAAYDTVEVQGTLCIKITSPVSAVELETIRRFPEVNNIRDGVFVELIAPPPPTKKLRMKRKPNPYDYANEIAWRIDTAIMHPRIAAWVEKKIAKQSDS